MGYERNYMAKLRKDRDDAKRAQAYDEAYPSLSEAEKAFCDQLTLYLMAYRGLGEKGAKAVVIELILLFHMKPDELERRIAHGRAIQAEYEWSQVKHHEDEAML